MHLNNWLWRQQSSTVCENTGTIPSALLGPVSDLATPLSCLILGSCQEAGIQIGCGFLCLTAESTVLLPFLKIAGPLVRPYRALETVC